MHKIKLPSVTLLGIDCVNIDRLVMVSKLCQRHVEFGAVKLLSSLSSNCKMITQIPDIASHEEYSKFVIKGLNKYVQTSHVLTMQHDGFVLNYRAWDERFLDYDYIGAPWCYTDGLNVGNGGFSLRSKRLLEILSEDARIGTLHPEDHQIGRTYRRYLERKGIRFAPESLASQFSIEGNIKHGWKWTGQFGFHSYQATDLSNWNVFKNAHPLYDMGFLLKYLGIYVQQKRFQKLRQKRYTLSCQQMIDDSKYLIEEGI